MSKKKIRYGIDFGTTNSTVAYVDKNNQIIKIPIDPESENPFVMRSIIYASPDGQFVFGKSAIDAYLLSIAENKDKSKKTIFTGNYINVNDEKGHDKQVPEIVNIDVHNGGRLFQSLKSALSNESINNINVYGKIYKIEELVGLFLKEIKNRADKIVGQQVTSAVVGRPVKYVGGNNKLAIKRMVKACKLAGLVHVDLEYEPVGAAFDHGVKIEEHQNVLIFDFGGGTLDLSIINFPAMKVLLSSGLPIGGDHFNSKIFMNKLAKFFGSEATWGEKSLEFPRHIFDSLKSWYNISLLKTNEFANTLDSLGYNCSDRKSLKRLRSLVSNNLGFSMYEEIERVKKDLSNKQIGLYKFNNKDIDIETKITKKEFELIIKDDLDEIVKFINNSLKRANFKTKDIDIVVTTGGSSLIPIIQNLLVNIFSTNKIQRSDEFTSVASGLAVMANKD